MSCTCTFELCNEVVGQHNEGSYNESHNSGRSTNVLQVVLLTAGEREWGGENGSGPLSLGKAVLGSRITAVLTAVRQNAQA